MDIDSKPFVDFSFNDTKVYDVKSLKVLVSLMMNLPHGVLRMSPTVSGLVQTSIAFSELCLKSDENSACCGLFARSMSMNEMKELDRKLNSLIYLFGDNCGIEIPECTDLFCGWILWFLLLHWIIVKMHMFRYMMKCLMFMLFMLDWNVE